MMIDYANLIEFKEIEEKIKILELSFKSNKDLKTKFENNPANLLNTLLMKNLKDEIKYQLNNLKDDLKIKNKKSCKS